MKTQTVTIKELQPDDQVFIKRTPDYPVWHTLREILTVRETDGDVVLIKESGGLCLKADTYEKVIPDQEETLSKPQLELFT